MARNSTFRIIAPLAALTFFSVYKFTPPNAHMNNDEQIASERAVFYSNCTHVRAAGKAPLYRGDPGYHERMDRDGDGIACEPYRGR
ncbi:MAG: excalibur calcium-binding domain-containing protein [Sphingorhabdus sp.]